VTPVTIRPEARRDLIEIHGYTADVWGEAQADRYLAEIDQVIRRIAEGTAVTRPAESVRPGYRKTVVRRHIIYFRATPERIEIVRVLHERMDPGRHV